MIDLKQTADGDIDMTTGDVQWAATDRATEQHKRDILLSAQGDYKASPLVGVGIVEYLNGNDSDTIRRDITIQLQKDGVKVRSVQFDTNGELVIDGDYENDNNRG